MNGGSAVVRDRSENSKFRGRGTNEQILPPHHTVRLGLNSSLRRPAAPLLAEVVIGLSSKSLPTHRDGWPQIELHPWSNGRHGTATKAFTA